MDYIITFTITIQREKSMLYSICQDPPNIDITVNQDDEDVEVIIKDNGKVLWVNMPNGCVLRICCIRNLTIDDRR